MYVKTTCPHCGESVYNSIDVHGTEAKNYTKGKLTYVDFNLEYAEILETVTREDFLKDLMLTLRHVKKKLNDEELCELLIRLFGLSKSDCRELLPAIRAGMNTKGRRVKTNL